MSSFARVTTSRKTAAARRRLALLLLTVFVLALVPTSASSAPAGHSTNPVLAIPPPFPPAIVGTSTLVRTDHGMTLRVATSGLEPGDVATLWVIVANDPDDCQAGLPGLTQCGPEDHLAGRGEMSVHYGNGRIVRSDGTASYAAHLRVGDTSQALFEGDPGLTDARGAEVIAILKTHGPKIPGLVPDQLHTFAGGCADQSTPPGLTVRPELLGTPGNNDCAEIQVSVHSP